jgi:hypothetical protein
MYKKRGQVTAFVVVGILLLIGSALIFLMYNKGAQTEAEIELLEAEIVKAHVQNCIKEITVPGIFLMSYQGGRLYTDEDVTQPGFDKKNFRTIDRVFPYYIIEGKKFLPQMKEIEQSLATYIDENLYWCVDFLQFIEQGLVVEEISSPKTKVNVARKEVVFTVDYPIRVRVGAPTVEREYQLKRFRHTEAIRLGEIFTAAEKMTDQIVADSSSAHLSDFMKIGKKHDVMISILPYDEESTAYSLYDEQSSLRDASLTFWFGSRNTMGMGGSLNTPPKITNYKDFTLKRNLPFTYELEVFDREGDAVSYQSDNQAIPIQPSGIFDFTPIQVGKFKVNISVHDSRGMSSSEILRFVVEE